MQFKAIIHDAEEGGFWAEVPAVPGCVTQAETMDELVANLKEAIEGCLSVPIPDDAIRRFDQGPVSSNRRMGQYL